MHRYLAALLRDTYLLIKDSARERGTPAGAALELDIERLAHRHYLSTERRSRRGALGRPYYSGLTRETDLFAYAQSEFLQTEAKDYARCIGGVEVTDLFGRAMDLHLGNPRDRNDGRVWEHHVALVAAGGANETVRGACLRFGIVLIEPSLAPLPVLNLWLPNRTGLLTTAGCSELLLHLACLPFSQRFAHEGRSLRINDGPLHSDKEVRSLLRFQAVATRAMTAELAALARQQLMR